MSPFQRHRWFIAAAGITLAYAVVSLVAHKSFGLTVFSDVVGVLIMLAAGGIMLANAASKPGIERSFWKLMALGFALWCVNQYAWAHYEILLRQPLPDPYFADIVLFFHLVPMIAAVAWRPDRVHSESRLHLSTLHFFMLLVWWIFLYAFIVFPHQYVVLNVDVYNRYYDWLYVIENLVLVAVLAYAVRTSAGPWKRVYVNLLGAGLVYAAGSQLLDKAVVNGTYYSGCWYDVPLVGAVVWIMATAAASRQWDLKAETQPGPGTWRTILPQVATLSILSLPVLGLWTFLGDRSPVASRTFRLFAVLAAMLVLGAFAFLRQYIQDQAVMDLLGKSRASYETQQRLQNHLVQKAKLASLGQLVAGAAHEINQPLAAILENSDQLWSGNQLTTEQDALVRKITHQARRTRDLVTDLLSFAQQTPGEKAVVDLGSLLQRGVQMHEAQRVGGRIRIEIFVEPEFPRVTGNANQLFQVISEIIENAMDALEESGGGTLQITGQRLGSEAVLQFSDTGPGLQQPERVFDPFYTTKPVGKGTGLGLSAVYGVMQDHGGQITCQNKPTGGALFVVRLPAASEPVAQAAKA